MITAMNMYGEDEKALMVRGLMTTMAGARRLYRCAVLSAPAENGRDHHFEPADLLWHANGCAVLIYITAQRRKAIKHNLHQAGVWLREWKTGREIIANNDYERGRKLRFEDFPFKVVLSVVKGSAEIIHHDDHVRDWGEDYGVTLCATITFDQLTALTRAGASVRDLLMVMDRARTDRISDRVASSYSPIDIRGRVQEQRQTRYRTTSRIIQSHLDAAKQFIQDEYPDLVTVSSEMGEEGRQLMRSLRVHPAIAPEVISAHYSAPDSIIAAIQESVKGIYDENSFQNTLYDLFDDLWIGEYLTLWKSTCKCLAYCEKFKANFNAILARGYHLYEIMLFRFGDVEFFVAIPPEFKAQEDLTDFLNNGLGILEKARKEGRTCVWISAVPGSGNLRYHPFLAAVIPPDLERHPSSPKLLQGIRRELGLSPI